jgi:hypothetical protein
MPLKNRRKLFVETEEKKKNLLNRYYIYVSTSSLLVVLANSHEWISIDEKRVFANHFLNQDQQGRAAFNDRNHTRPSMTSLAF